MLITPDTPPAKITWSEQEFWLTLIVVIYVGVPAGTTFSLFGPFQILHIVQVHFT